MEKRVKLYFHRNKEDNQEILEKLGFDQDTVAYETALYLGYEIEVYFDINMETGEAKLVGAEGFFLGDEAVTEGEFDE